MCHIERSFLIFAIEPSTTNVSEHRQRGRFAEFSLYISNDGNIDCSFLCYKNGPLLPTRDFDTTCITSGRYIIFYKELPTMKDTKCQPVS